MSALNSILDWMLLASLRASVLVLVVLAVRAVMWKRLPARWRYALWLPVLAALLLPGIPLLPTLPGWPLLTVKDVSQAEASVERIAAADGDVNGTIPSVAGVEAPVVSAGGGPAATGAPLSLLFWRRWLAGVWLAGAALVAGGAGGAYALTMRRIRRRTVHAAPELLERIACLSREVGLRHAPRVWQSPHVPSPAVCGLWRPALLLNAGFPAELSGDEADMVLRHELIHIRRGDVVLNTVLCILLALHWFNPLLWLAFFRACADREAACDADVLRDEPAPHRAAYGHTLLKMETAFPPSSLCLGLVGILQRGGALRKRLQDIIAQPKLSAFAKTTLALGLIAVAVLGLAKAAEPQTQKTVGPTEFKRHFARVGMEETLRSTEFAGIEDGRAVILVRQMSWINARKWSVRQIAVNLTDLDPALRAQVEAAMPCSVEEEAQAARPLRSHG